MNYYIVLLLIVLLSLVLENVQGRGIWGSRRKRESEEESIRDSSDDINTFEQANRVASAQAASRRKRPAAASSSSSSLLSMQEGLGDKVKELIEAYVNFMEEIVESPEYDEHINPKTIRTLFDQFSQGASFDSLGAAGNEVKAMLESPQFTDPILLKKTIKDGIQMLKQYSSTITAMLNDPEQLQQLISQLPPDMQILLESFMSGDTSGLKSLIDQMPGLQPEHKKMISDLLDGNSEVFNKEVQSSLGNMMNALDYDQIEAARLQLLDNLEIASSFGITEDVIQDKEKFHELVQEGLLNFNDEQPEKTASSNKLGGAFAREF
jgi:hypothetical protein